MFNTMSLWLMAFGSRQITVTQLQKIHEVQTVDFVFIFHSLPSITSVDWVSDSRSPADQWQHEARRGYQVQLKNIYIHIDMYIIYMYIYIYIYICRQIDRYTPNHTPIVSSKGTSERPGLLRLARSFLKSSIVVSRFFASWPLGGTSKKTWFGKTKLPSCNLTQENHRKPQGFGGLMGFNGILMGFTLCCSDQTVVKLLTQLKRNHSHPQGPSRIFKGQCLGYNFLLFGGLSTFSDSVWIHRAIGHVYFNFFCLSGFSGVCAFACVLRPIPFFFRRAWLVGTISMVVCFMFWSSNSQEDILVGGLEHFLIFPYTLGILIPIDFHIFRRGRSTTNQLYIGNRSKPLHGVPSFRTWRWRCAPTWNACALPRCGAMGSSLRLPGLVN